MAHVCCDLQAIFQCGCKRDRNYRLRSSFRGTSWHELPTGRRFVTFSKHTAVPRDNTKRHSGLFSYSFFGPCARTPIEKMADLHEKPVSFYLFTFLANTAAFQGSSWGFRWCRKGLSPADVGQAQARSVCRFTPQPLEPFLYSAVGNYSAVGDYSAVGRYSAVGHCSTVGHYAAVGRYNAVGHYSAVDHQECGRSHLAVDDQQCGRPLQCGRGGTFRFNIL